jgi:hypothetical protein
MINPTAQIVSNPQMIDSVLIQFNTHLMNELIWLDNAYTKCDRIIETIDNQNIISPVVYTSSSNEYIRLFPDSHIGNFSFFDTQGITTFRNEPRIKTRFKDTLKWIVWFDYRTVFTGSDETHTIENIKHQVTDAFKSIRIINGQIHLKRFLERTSMIYGEYNIREIHNQYLMRPYGALALEFELIYSKETNCSI